MTAERLTLLLGLDSGMKFLSRNYIRDVESKRTSQAQDLQCLYRPYAHLHAHMNMMCFKTDNRPNSAVHAGDRQAVAIVRSPVCSFCRPTLYELVHWFNVGHAVVLGGPVTRVGPTGQGPSKNRQCPGKNNWTVMFHLGCRKFF